MDDLRNSLIVVVDRINHITGGAPRIVKEAFDRFGQANAAHVAAALAYYTVFSLFPLILALIAAGSFFLEGELVQQQVVRTVTGVIPIAEDVILSNVEQVLERRGTVGGVGLLGLLWSGTGVFTVLVNHINRAWVHAEYAESRSFVEQRLLGLGIGLIGVLAALLTIALLSTPVLNLLPRLTLGLAGETRLVDTPIWTLIATGVPAVVSFLIFLNLYRWVPNTKVRWSEAAWGAGVVSATWEIAKRAFAWYVSSGLVQYRLVYGSLGAVVALLLWIYLSAWLLLFGAHLSAAIARHRRGPGRNID